MRCRGVSSLKGFNASNLFGMPFVYERAFVVLFLRFLLSLTHAVLSVLIMVRVTRSYVPGHQLGVARAQHLGQNSCFAQQPPRGWLRAAQHAILGAYAKKNLEPFFSNSPEAIKKKIFFFII